MPLRVFLPTFAVYSIDTSTDWSTRFNPEELFIAYWKKDGAYDVNTVLCDKLVDSWTDLSEGHRKAIKDEFVVADYPSLQLMCPNITDFELSSLVIDKTKDKDKPIEIDKLRLRVDLTEDGK